jgi:integrating conjugative element protein (TIGR03755 family)
VAEGQEDAHMASIPSRIKHELRAAAVASACVTMLGQAAAAEPPGLVAPTRQTSSLYYRIGGGDPAPLAANPNALTLRLGLSGGARISYSCGRFSIGDAFEYYMSEFKNLGQTIQAGIGAAVMALPLYIFQRAQPGLYETFQSYWAKAQVAISAALKTCEEMEAQIKAGGDPYQDYINLAKGEGWKVEASSGTNVLAAKQRVQRDGGNSGVAAFPGIQRGGKDQPPLRIVHDTTAVGFNVTMGQMPSAPTSTSFPPSSRLTRLWQTPRAAADWAVSVLGDQQVATCDDASCGSGDGVAGKGIVTGLGLQPKYEASVTEVETAMVALVASGDTTYEKLHEVSAPGVAVTKDVIDALRRLPADTRGSMTKRLAREVALSNTIERAFAIRDLLQTGMTAITYDKPFDDARKRVEQLNRYIDDLAFEQRVRKEVVSNTAQLLIEHDRNTAAARSSSVPPGRQGSPRTLEDGKVAP